MFCHHRKSLRALTITHPTTFFKKHQHPLVTNKQQTEKTTTNVFILVSYSMTYESLQMIIWFVSFPQKVILFSAHNASIRCLFCNALKLTTQAYISGYKTVEDLRNNSFSVGDSEKSSCSVLCLWKTLIVTWLPGDGKRTNREDCNALDRIAENPPEPGMSRLATKRIQNELAAMQNDPPPGCVLSEMGDDIFRSEALLSSIVARSLKAHSLKSALVLLPQKAKTSKIT